MVGNFGKRLEPYGVQVRELTGDINLTKQEIENTQVMCVFGIVCLYVFVYNVFVCNAFVCIRMECICVYLYNVFVMYKYMYDLCMHV